MSPAACTADPLAVSFGARVEYALNDVQSSHASVLHLGSIDRCGLSNPVGRAPSLIKTNLAQEDESTARASNQVQSAAKMRHRSRDGRDIPSGSLKRLHASEDSPVLYVFNKSFSVKRRYDIFDTYDYSDMIENFKWPVEKI